MGRPPKFSREQLQAAALTIVDADGATALSMRSLAAALGTGPMTLYNHVDDRADLDVLVVDAVLGQMKRPRTKTGDWQVSVEAIATAFWRAVRAHPHTIPLILTRRSRSQVVLDRSEALLDALAGSGRSGKDLLVAFRAVQAYVMGFAQAELAGPLASAADEPADVVIERFRALPAEQYPHLVEIAEAAATSTPDAEFRTGLRALLAGLAAS